MKCIEGQRLPCRDSKKSSEITSMFCERLGFLSKFPSFLFCFRGFHGKQLGEWRHAIMDESADVMRAEVRKERGHSYTIAMSINSQKA